MTELPLSDPAPRLSRLRENAREPRLQGRITPILSPADPANASYRLMRDGAIILGIGITIGLAGAMVMGQVLRRFLFGIDPNDPVAFAAVCLILTAVGAAACFVPALRATRVSPLTALRTE